MKRWLLFFPLLCCVSLGIAQNDISNLRNKTGQTSDSATLRFISSIWDSIASNPQAALNHIQKNILLSNTKKLNYGLQQSYAQYAYLEQLNGNYPAALKYSIQSLRAAERTGSFVWQGFSNCSLGDIYKESGDYNNAIKYSRKAKSLFEKNYTPVFTPGPFNDTLFGYFFSLLSLAKTYERFNYNDSALHYAEFLNQAWKKVHAKVDLPALLLVLGNIHLKSSDYQRSLNYYREGAAVSLDKDEKDYLMESYLGMGKVFYVIGKVDSSIYYAHRILEVSKVGANMAVKIQALGLLANAFKLKQNGDSVAKYLESTIVTKDSLFSQQKAMQFQSITFNEHLRQLERQDAQVRYHNKVIKLILIGGLALLAFIIGILYRSNLLKQTAKVKVEHAYHQLQSTQAQLIQSEKMASLGELTAGIAHEIQNPLNFVNNFSEVNSELLAEMRQEISMKNYDEVDQLAKNVEDNQQKINEHGKRAESIVKGMLLHSRSSSGAKEPTDINKQADEFLRLAYHGFRARDKVFNAVIETHYDPSVGSINIVPQELGRVFLNLFNNAFYAVNEKKKQQQDGYEPGVSVSTKRTEGKVIISVQDNGNGIPQKVVDKIFQPFFTTKPTGQGTGLGLSLAYDIVKAHGGEITVSSAEGAHTKFTVLLPALSGV